MSWLEQAIEAEGLSDSQPHFLSVELATVVYAVPALNIYLIEPWHNIDSSSGGPFLFTATSLAGTSMYDGGTTETDAYSPGTTVLVGRLSPSKDLNATSGDYVDVIIGTAPTKPLADENNEYPDNYTFPGVDLNLYSNQMIEAIEQAAIGANKNTAFIQDRSYGRPLDSLAGDKVVSGECGPFNAVGKHVAGLGASPLSRIEFHALQNKCRLFNECLSMESHVSEEGYYIDKEAYVFFKRRGLDVYEGLGSYTPDAPPFRKDEETGTWLPANTSEEFKQRGIYRHEELEGKLVDGVWETIQLPEPGEGVRTSEPKPDDPQLGLLSERKMYDGTYELRSANSLSFVKSLFIPTHKTLEKEPDTAEMENSTGEAKSWQEEKELDDKEMSAALAIATADEFNHNNEKYHQDRMRARPDNWEVASREKLEDRYGVDLEKTQMELEALPEEEFEYPMPPELTVTDPATGKEYTYYAAESGIQQLSDGSVIITDGAGSQITMSKGNVTISCAGDLKVIPGRDNINMAGRHSILNAGKDVQLQSANGDLSIKAENSMSMLSGNSGVGEMVIENRATEVNEEEGAVYGIGKGVIIKSRSDASLVGTNLYIGINDVSDDSEGGLARSKGGSLVIDACAGIFAAFGREGYLKFDRQTVLASATGGQGSSITLDKGEITHMTSKIKMGTGAVEIGSPAGDVSLKKLGPNGVVDDSFGVSAGDPSLKVAGPVTFAQSLKVGTTVKATDVNAGNGAFGNGGVEYWGGGGSGPGTVTVPTVSDSVAGGVSSKFASEVVPSDNKVYTGKGIKRSELAYKAAADLNLNDFRLYVSKWQSMRNTNGSGLYYWHEPIVLNYDEEETYVYPGKSNWKDEKRVYSTVEDFAQGEASQKMEDGIIVSAQQT
jgi:hypothetical protein